MDISASLLEQVNQERRETHRRVLELVAQLSDEQLCRRPGAHAPSIGFHVWHLARWADHDRAGVDGKPEIWQARGLAREWGFPEAGLGQADTGTGMGDDAAELLVLPRRAALLGYAGDTFAALDATLASIPVESLMRPLDGGEPLLNLVCGFLSHDNRHLGMIEALRGVLGLSGTATN